MDVAITASPLQIDCVVIGYKFTGEVNPNCSYLGLCAGLNHELSRFDTTDVWNLDNWNHSNYEGKCLEMLLLFWSVKEETEGYLPHSHDTFGDHAFVGLVWLDSWFLSALTIEFSSLLHHTTHLTTQVLFGISPLSPLLLTNSKLVWSDLSSILTTHAKPFSFSFCNTTQDTHHPTDPSYFYHRPKQNCIVKLNIYIS